VLTSSAVDRGFEPWLGKTKDYKIGICYISTKQEEYEQRMVGSESGCVQGEPYVYS